MKDLWTRSDATVTSNKDIRHLKRVKKKTLETFVES
jgi:hypothetical protein